MSKFISQLGAYNEGYADGAASRDAEIAELKEKLKVAKDYFDKLARLGNGDRYGTAKSIGYVINSTDLCYVRKSDSDAEIAKLKTDNEHLYVSALERDQLKERLDFLIESSEMLAAELDELRLDSKRYGYLTRECRSRDFIIPASERKQSIDSAIDKVLSATKHHDRS